MWGEQLVKKTKIISIVVAMLGVVALGVFMGKYMFRLMEATGTPTGDATTQTSQTASNNNVKVLYGEQNNSGNTVEPPTTSAQAAQTAIPVNVKDVQTSTATAVQATQSNVQPTTQENKPQENSNANVFTPDGPKWYAYSTTKGLNVRETPDKKGRLLFKMGKDTRGVVREKKDGWTKVKWDYNKKEGWSIDDYLLQGPAAVVSALVNNSGKAEKVDKEQLKQATVEKAIEKSKVVVATAKPAPISETVVTYTNGKNLPQRGTITPQNGANIREQPNTQSAKLIKLPKGTIVGIKSVKQVDKYQWFEITFSNGTKTGWTREDNLQF